MNPPNSFIMKIIVLTWLVNENLFNTKILILNNIGRWNHHQIPLVHEGKRSLWSEGNIFTSSHWPKEINWRRGQVRGSLNLESLLFLLCVKCSMCYRKSVWEKEANWICVNVCYSWAQWCVEAKGTWKKIRCRK
jgi:hypothetical protein